MIRWAYLAIAAGAALWGTIGLFVQELYSLGLTPLQVVTLRVSCAVSFLLIYSLFVNRQWLRVQLKDSPLFIGTGIISIVFFNWCFFVAIQETSISVAAILLYTAPAFVLILSRFLFKELLTARKVLSLILTLFGCILVVELLPNGSMTMTTVGIIAGLGSGLFYGLYSIFGKFALRKYHPMTVTIYTFLFAALFTLPVSQVWTWIGHLNDVKLWIYAGSLGLFPTVLAFIFYTKGLKQVEAGKASIVATLEPVVAAFIGMIFYSEILTLWQYLGVVCVIFSVIIVQNISLTKWLEKRRVKQSA
ncbi:DMT family transporter [Alkalihalobacterium chitinilyticum]|uniref:DMT family transporter n=1 Tax=Alkalihalobacterium chitinilyticum TaxID=2980103 RepID=UPI0027E4D236|nr:DMT family transporter [Alkalihalobacterium chitinilyticum]